MDCDYGSGWRRETEHELTSPPVGWGGKWIAKEKWGNAKIPDLAITNLSKD
jgi:hypothetical protein